MVSAIVGVIALVIGIGVGWVLRSGQSGGAPAPGGAPIPPPSGQYPPPVPQPAPRPDAKLVQTLIHIADLAEAQSVRAEVAEGLQHSGVHPVAPAPGAMFDPAQHKAVDSAAATSPMEVDTIARVLRPGWASADGVIRFAEVAVFSPPAAAAPGPR